ncbi:MAG: hypothetical protein K2Y37_07420 [Pirellulales bacterium]|nr:hypothetical protein [Pirellulales bacterium]
MTNAHRNDDGQLRRRFVRRGITLIEVVAVAAMSSLLTGLAVTALILAIKNSDAAHGDLATRIEIARLTRQFRRDVHAARRATLAGAPDLVTFNNGEAVVRYRQAGDRLEREEFASDRDCAGDAPPTKRDSYRLPSGFAATIDSAVSGNDSFVRLQISPTRNTEPNLATSRVSHVGRSHNVEAWLGRDHRGIGTSIEPVPGASAQAGSRASETTALSATRRQEAP